MTDTLDMDFSDLSDAIPPGMADIEYPCANCGREIGYGGRGRKPTAKSKCAECKPARRDASTTPKVTGANATMAAQATEVLSQMNSFVALLAMAVGFPQTASALASTDEGFRAAAYSALVTDKELCAFICKGGVKSAKLALVMAYAGQGMVVIPTAINEFKERQAAREEG